MIWGLLSQIAPGTVPLFMAALAMVAAAQFAARHGAAGDAVTRARSDTRKFSFLSRLRLCASRALLRNIDSPPTRISRKARRSPPLSLERSRFSRDASACLARGVLRRRLVRRVEAIVRYCAWWFRARRVTTTDLEFRWFLRVCRRGVSRLECTIESVLESHETRAREYV